MIYLARFTGRKLNATGIMYRISAYCHGADPVEAHLELYNRFDHIVEWKLEPVEVVKVSVPPVGTRVQIINDFAPILGTVYRVAEHNEIIGARTCTNKDGIKVSVHPSQNVIVMDSAVE